MGMNLSAVLAFVSGPLSLLGTVGQYVNYIQMDVLTGVFDYRSPHMCPPVIEVKCVTVQESFVFYLRTQHVIE